MDKRNLTGFFFVYTSCFTHNPDKLEIYRYFRSTKYQHIDQFYNNFFSFTKTYFPELFFQAEKILIRLSKRI